MNAESTSGAEVRTTSDANNVTNLRKRMMRENHAPGSVFDKTPTGWLLSLLFFPSGVISLFLIVLLLKRTDFIKADDLQEGKILKAGRFKMHADGSLRGLRGDEIERIISEHKLSRVRQRELEKGGKILAESCGYCMGTGARGWYVGLPCGHYHHARCVKSALEGGVSRCADCGFCMKTLVL